MKVLITGGEGQLGLELARILSPHHLVFSFGRQELDVTHFPTVSETIRKIKPHVIIHAAAYTQVDLAESNQLRAYLVNTYGTRNVVAAGEQIGAKIIYISTNYVFDGQSSIPYKETDAANPLNVYGKSKLEGEEMVKSFCERHYIIRTSWLYGKHGRNFVKKMLTMAQDQQELFVVNDQIASPTYTMDLAQFIKGLIETDKYGIYHVSNTGDCSWYLFAQAILEEAGLAVKINPIAGRDFFRAAVIPAYSVLDHTAIRSNGFSDLRHWREALKEFISLNEHI